MEMSCFVRRFRRVALLVPGLAAMAAGAGAQGLPPNINDTIRASVNSQGGQAFGDSREASISADGRFVAFSSESGNLVPGDNNFVTDIFVHDRQTGQTVRVNVDDQGNQAVDGDSVEPVISGDGRWVAFTSSASNLLGEPLPVTVPRPQVYVHDRQTGRTFMVSDPANGFPDGRADEPAISADGHYVAFRSDAENLVGSLDGNGFSDVFFHNLFNGVNSLASVGPDNQSANGPSSQPAVMSDVVPPGEQARHSVAFVSEATNLAGTDTNGVADVYLREVAASGAFVRTSRVSVRFQRVCGELAGRPFCFNVPIQPNGPSANPDISLDGNLVAYDSEASNLVAGDTNGHRDVFLSDRTAATTIRVSVAADGTQGDDDSRAPALEDGLVAFESFATNLVPGGSNGALQLFVRSSLGPVSQVSFSGNGIEANSQSIGPDLACRTDPTFPITLRCDIAFSSVADNLVANDTNGDRDAFVRTQRLLR
jgi:hypothetical protein